MNYLYHWVPENMEGDTLYPLNVLKEKYPKVYEAHVSKYIGREHLMEERIGPLNCLWNDVLHFTTVHPSEIKQALHDAGNKDFSRRYYQINPQLLDSKNAVVYLYSDNDLNKPPGDDFAPYDPKDIEKYSHIPQDTKDYYKETITKGEYPLLYHRTPHILYKGSIDIANIPIITV